MNIQSLCYRGVKNTQNPRCLQATLAELASLVPVPAGPGLTLGGSGLETASGSCGIFLPLSSDNRP